MFMLPIKNIVVLHIMKPNMTYKELIIYLIFQQKDTSIYLRYFFDFFFFL